MHENELVLEGLSVDGGISAVKFCPFERSQTHLLVASWDSSLRLFDTAKNSIKATFHSRGAILDCCFSKASWEEFYSVGLDTTVKKYDLRSNKHFDIGHHSKPIRCVRYSGSSGLVASGGWDGMVKTWDCRSNTPLVNQLTQSGKVFAMDVWNNRLVVGTSTKKISMYDLRKPDQPLSMKDSPLKFQTRYISIFANGNGYALSSTEGRVALEYFEDSADRKKNYAFKCHRQKQDGQTIVYPVNSIAFHPTFGTFATGGCDGVVNIWDGDNKKRINQFRRFPTSISAMDFNFDGSALAIASSYSFEEGEKDHPDDTIVIRSVQAAEVRPKNKSSKA